MRTNDFIKEHITIDERARISKKLNLLSKKHLEFGRYLELIQKEDVAKIFIHADINGFLVSGMLKDSITHNSAKHYINTLLVSAFIHQVTPSDSMLQIVTENYNLYIAEKTNYYKLTKKGLDFLEIDYVEEYLNTEYEDYKNELL